MRSGKAVVFDPCQRPSSPTIDPILIPLWQKPSQSRPSRFLNVEGARSNVDAHMLSKDHVQHCARLHAVLKSGGFGNPQMFVFVLQTEFTPREWGLTSGPFEIHIAVLR